MSLLSCIILFVSLSFYLSFYLSFSWGGKMEVGGRREEVGGKMEDGSGIEGWRVGELEEKGRRAEGLIMS